MDYLYSLYDALISINVSNDRARAVVDAMGRDMGTMLATKSDLNMLRGELRQELALVRKDLEILATSMTLRLGSMLAGRPRRAVCGAQTYLAAQEQRARCRDAVQNPRIIRLQAPILGRGEHQSWQHQQRLGELRVHARDATRQVHECGHQQHADDECQYEQRRRVAKS